MSHVILLYIRKFLHMRSFVKIKLSRNGKSTLSFTVICKSCASHEFLTWQICLLTIFAKNKILAKISELTVPGNMWSSMPIAVAQLGVVSPHPDRCIAWLLKR